jgi:toluene monooxygenase system protein E
MDDTLKPLRTWSHLVGQRRRPSEYEIVSTGLLWHARGEEVPFEVEGARFMNDWVVRYRDNSTITHEDWDSFRDPDELVYRTYNILQDGQESYVDGLLDQYDREGHDESLPGAWLDVLEALYTPGRYLIHTSQMASAYLVHMAPASTIGNCAAFQTADALRWVSRIAYRTASLAKAHPDRSFGESERAAWENAPAWQGYRELMERTLVTYDWAEAFVALNLVALPAISEGFHRAMAQSARRNDDTLLALMAEAALRDADRSRRWTQALVDHMGGVESNRGQLQDWVDARAPYGRAAIEAFAGALPDVPDSAATGVEAMRGFHSAAGLATSDGSG